jgi:ribosome-associated protein
MESLKMMQTAVKALDSKKGIDIKVLDIKHISTLADYLVICNGTSTSQIKALADECEYQLEQQGFTVDHREGINNGGWVLLDYIDIIVHVYNNESRKFYDLERFWKDGHEVDIKDILDGEK